MDLFRVIGFGPSRKRLDRLDNFQTLGSCRAKSEIGTSVAISQLRL